MKRELILALTIALVSCGGGGGGGDATPAPPPNDLIGGTGTGASTPDIQTGVFSDSLVQGLSYSQGNIAGITNADGQFQYDANSNQPVVFSIGTLNIGSAKGASLVTPLDLNTQNNSVNYNRGINVTRLLIALDTDGNPDNGIQISAEAAAAAGDLPFDLPPLEFTNDSYVQGFETEFNITNLPDSATALSHLQDNQQASEQLAQVAKQVADIGNVTLSWNSNLRDAGLLEQVKADDGEQLYLFTKININSSMSVNNLIYLDAAGNYLLVSLDDNGNIDYVSINGKVSKVIANMDGPAQASKPYVNDAGGREIDYFHHNNGIFDFDHYSPQQQLMRVEIGGNAMPVAMQERHISQIDAIQSILNNIAASSATSDDALRLAGLFMHDVGSIMCSEFSNCGNNVLLSSLFDSALAGKTSALNKVTVSDESLDASTICVAIPVTGQIGVCGAGSSAQDALSGLLVQQGIAEQQWGAVSPVHQVVTRYLYLDIVDSSYQQSLIDGTLPTHPTFAAVFNFKTTVDLVKMNSGYLYYRINGFTPYDFAGPGTSVQWQNTAVAESDPLVAQNHQAMNDEVADLLRILQYHSGILEIPDAASEHFIQDLVGVAGHATPADAYVKLLSLHQSRYLGATPQSWVELYKDYKNRGVTSLIICDPFWLSLRANVYDSALTNSPARLRAFITTAK